LAWIPDKSFGLSGMTSGQALISSILRLLLVILVAAGDVDLIVKYSDGQIDRTATHTAVLYVVLLGHTAIDGQGYGLSTIGAVYLDRFEQIHQGL